MRCSLLDIKTHSVQPGAAAGDGGQDADTAPGPPPPAPARRSTAALRSESVITDGQSYRMKDAQHRKENP